MISIVASSQISYEQRIESELKDGYYNEEIFAFDENGFILTSKCETKENSKRKRKFELYSKDLELVKVDSVALNKRFKIEETFKGENFLHTLYKDTKGKFSIISISSKNFEITKVDGNLPKKMYISDMAVLGDYAYFNTRTNRSPYLFSLDWKTGKQDPIPIYIKSVKSKFVHLVGFQLLKESNEIMLFVNARVARRKYDTYIILLDDQGNKTGEYNLTAEIDENIIDVSSHNAGGGDYIFTGTYSTYNGLYSEGIFFCKANQGKVEYIEFYTYTSLDEFMSYLPERRQKKIEKRQKRKEKKGENLKLNYAIAMHDIVIREDGYYLLGEAYFKTYRTETQTATSTVNGVTTTSTTTKSVFDGYQYTHAILAKFSKDGELQWDRTFEMWPQYKPFHVKRFISVNEEADNSIKMVFVNFNKIVSKIVDNNGGVVKSKESNDIETGHEDDKTKRSYANIEYWYDNYFIVYGSQKIKNREDENVEKKRKVFFVSKLKFE